MLGPICFRLVGVPQQLASQILLEQVLGSIPDVLLVAVQA
jgi:hypothetical protein